MMVAVGLMEVIHCASSTSKAHRILLSMKRVVLFLGHLINQIMQTKDVLSMWFCALQVDFSPYVLFLRIRTRRNNWNDLGCDFDRFALCQRSCPAGAPTEAPTSTPTSLDDIVKDELLIQPQVFLAVFFVLLFLIVVLLIVHKRLMNKRAKEAEFFWR